MSKLLIQEPPLQVLPSLAKAIGLNEAIILQQIQYWMNSKNAGKMHDGQKWIYNSVANWQKDNFPFWSVQTIKRALTSLKKQELVLTANLNKASYDRTLWYTINYDQLKLVDQSISTECTNPLGQNGPMDEAKMDQPIPETTQETTTDIYINDGIATDSQINPIITAMQDVSKQKLHEKTETTYDDVATTIYSMGATPDLVAGFGEWWKENCWYKTPSKAALTTIADSWEEYMESAQTTEPILASDIKPPGKWNPETNKFVQVATNG